MMPARQSLIYAAVILWGFAIMLAVVLVFFPYGRALRVVSQNILGSSRTIIALEGSRFGLISAQASRVVVGRVAAQGKPLFELRMINARWYPFSLLKGKLAILCRAVAYDGMIECSIDGIPVLSAGIPVMRIKFEKVNLAKYPEGTVPWFKGISGSMSGWINQEVPLESRDKQKGSFRINMTAGEIKDLQVKGIQNFVLAYKAVLIEGRTSGSKIYLDKILVEGDGIKLKGNGTLEEGGAEPRISLVLACENSSSTSPLANGSVITVTGNQWSPTITITTEPARQAEKIAARTYNAQTGFTL